MSLPFHIAVFAKAPVPGAAKTRLIPMLGAEGAAAAQRAMTMRALQTACTAAPGHVSLWTAGANNHAFFAECMNRYRLNVYRQCPGDLGARMLNCLQSLLVAHSTVILIGTDCPALSVSHLQSAAQVLRQSARMIFIPAEDGGYVLVGASREASGGNRPPMLVQAFQDIEWGTPQVMAQTRDRLVEAGCQAGLDWIELPMLWDVDTPEDYQRALQESLLPSAA